MEIDRQRFQGAVELWKEWNERINVISRKDAANVFEHHVLHSLAIAEYLSRKGEDCRGLSFLDVGCGGGFPGIPLAMVFPESRFTLCDSIGKKIKVAQAVSDGVGLKNVTCVNARAESLPGSFDWVVSRAVTSLENFYPWVKGRYRRGILYLKGGDVGSEIAAMCSKFHVNPEKVSVWPVDEWLKDEYFAEKFVIEIGK